MTPTSTAAAVSTEALAELVATVADDFPAVGLQAGPADVQSSRDELLPADDAFVVISIAILIADFFLTKFVISMCPSAGE